VSTTAVSRSTEKATDVKYFTKKKKKKISFLTSFECRHPQAVLARRNNIAQGGDVVKVTEPISIAT
jgi:hypothetical protein